MKKIKGNEIINHVTSDISAKMPDIEQVRANCLNQKADEISKKNNIKKRHSVFTPARILATAAALIFMVGLINIQVVIAAVGGFVEETSKFVEKTFNKPEYYITVNTSPGNDDKFQGGGTNMTYNLNAQQKVSVIIQIHKKDEKGEIIEILKIATNDIVTMDKKNNIVIGGDTVIDREGNVIEFGSAACSIKKTDGAVIEINQSPIHRNDSMTDSARTEYEQSGISEKLIEMLPYMSQELIDEIAQNERKKSGLDNLSETIIPYISESTIDELAMMEYEKNGFENFSPHIYFCISKSTIDELVTMEYEKNGFENIDDTIYYFISESTIDKLAMMEYEKNGFDDFSIHIYPYISESTIDELVMMEYEKNGFGNFSIHIYPYISESTIDELAMMEYEKNGFDNFSVHIYPYMSENIVDELATIEYEKNGFDNFSPNIYFYISENTIHELVITEYEKNGLENMENVAYYASYISESCVEEIKRKEYEKTGEYPMINDNIGRYFTRKDNGLEIIETPFMGEIRYITVEINDETSEEITKVGKDGEYAEIYTKNRMQSNATANITINDGDKIAVVNRNADGVMSITVEQNGNSETTELNPEINPVITLVLNSKTVEISQTSKGSTAYVRVTKGDVTARIKVTKNAEINVFDYLITNPLYGN